MEKKKEEEETGIDVRRKVKRRTTNGEEIEQLKRKQTIWNIKSV